MTDDISPARGTREPLSPRERVTLGHIAAGLTNTRIGERLGLSENTVKSHLRRVFLKLGARDRAHAVSLGYQQGLLSLTDDGEPVGEQMAVDRLIAMMIGRLALVERDQLVRLAADPVEHRRNVACMLAHWLVETVDVRERVSS
jgi:DNA-binding CsgD family transcriptional regulator